MKGDDFEAAYFRLDAMFNDLVVELSAEKARADAAERDAGNLKNALLLIWRIFVRDNVHLGLERASGIEKNCIACICAGALGQGMDGFLHEEIASRLAALLATDK